MFPLIFAFICYVLAGLNAYLFYTSTDPSSINVIAAFVCFGSAVFNTIVAAMKP